VPEAAVPYSKSISDTSNIDKEVTPTEQPTLEHTEKPSQPTPERTQTNEGNTCIYMYNVIVKYIFN